jgi:hypothetical protein
MALPVDGRGHVASLMHLQKKWNVTDKSQKKKAATRYERRLMISHPTSNDMPSEIILVEQKNDQPSDIILVKQKRILQEYTRHKNQSKPRTPRRQRVFTFSDRGILCLEH